MTLESGIPSLPSGTDEIRFATYDICRTNFRITTVLRKSNVTKKNKKKFLFYSEIVLPLFLLNQ
jgi:hypothetical protein